MWAPDFRIHALNNAAQHESTHTRWLQVVDHERSDLQESAMRLVRQLAEYTITLKQLEDNLLARLAASQVHPACLAARAHCTC